MQHRPSLVWRSPRTQLAGWGEALRFDCGTGIERFARGAGVLTSVWSEVDNPDGLPGPPAVASFTFDERTPGSVVIVPEVMVVGDSRGWRSMEVDGHRLDAILERRPDPAPQIDRPRYAGSSVPDVLWMQAVSEAISQIEGGLLEKVVLARDYALWSKFPIDSQRVLARLIERFPQCHVFLVDGLVGASPELLLHKQGRRVESVALAGSAPRGEDAESDRRLSAELLHSEKDRREHELAAASVAEVLASFCPTLHRPEHPELLALDNLFHLATPFVGTLGSDIPSIELVAHLHPTAAVGGAPRVTALELIRRLEGMNRGRYAGPLGWFDARGEGEWAIALRCAELSGARARLFAGGGIVKGSLPEAELEETRLKLRAMLSALE